MSNNRETLAREIAKVYRDNSKGKIDAWQMNKQINEINARAKLVNLGPMDVGNMAMLNYSEWEKEMEAEEQKAAQKK